MNIEMVATGLSVLFLISGVGLGKCLYDIGHRDGEHRYPSHTKVITQRQFDDGTWYEHEVVHY